MESLRRAFRGIFKRGKKTKSEPEQPQEHHAVAPSEPSKPPQLPPVQHASPIERPEENASKPLPPTHPLATGQHSQPQTAVPQRHDLQPSAAPPSNTAGLAGVEDKSARPEENPVLASRVEEQDRRVEANVPPQTNYLLADQPAASQPAGEVEHRTTTPHGLSTTSMESPKTDSGIGEDQAVTAPTASKTDTTPQTSGIPAISDEKMPVASEEPPPIKAVRAAPGMSATSGPLEDFPEGGYHLRAD